MYKLTSDELNDIVIESLSLSVALLERFETMNENNLFTHRAKQSLKQTIPHIEGYVGKLIEVRDEEDAEHFKRGATVIMELSNRIDSALKVNNILDISSRKRHLEALIDATVLFPPQKKELYEAIRDSGILEY
jgi:response regulator RpfG family c-di-GMP phosphodiesterase